MAIDTEKRDHRMDSNPEYWQHSEASLQFHKVAHVPICLTSAWYHRAATPAQGGPFASGLHFHWKHKMQITRSQLLCIDPQ